MVGGNEAGATTMETVFGGQTIKIKLLYDPAILLSIWSIIIQSDTCTPMLIALFAIAKIWKQPKCS